MASPAPPPATKDRSCVILATDNAHAYTLHHIDVAPFFSGPDPDTQAMDDDVPLPPASARFDRPPDGLLGCAVDFHLLRGGGTHDDEVKVVSTDSGRRTAIYDVARRAVRGGPTMRVRKGSPVSVAVGDGLFVIERVVGPGGRCFEALRYDRLLGDWYWHGLPSPPYVRDPGYQRSSVTAITPAAGGRIWTTTERVGTYSFDTRRRSWRKEGDWALPFLGEAEHVPGRGDGLSFAFLAVETPFGYTSRNGPLCAVDLATATADSPPAVRGVWEEFKPPGEWTPSTSSLVHLGSGKICVFRFFHTDRTDTFRNKEEAVVITAVEVSPQDGGDGEIKMVKHRSKCIRFDKHHGHITWIL